MHKMKKGTRKLRNVMGGSENPTKRGKKNKRTDA